MAPCYRFLTLILLTGLVGCNMPSSDKALADAHHDSSAANSTPMASPPGGVGTVDIQRISRSIGPIQEVEQRLRKLQQQFNAFVEEKRAAYNKELKRYPEKSEDRSAEQNRKLAEFVKASDLAIQGVKTQVDKQANDLNAYAGNVLRDRVRGPIQDIAKKHGLAVVLLEPNVFYHTPEADITGEVLEAMHVSPLDAPNVVPPTGSTLGQQPIKGSDGKPSGESAGDKNKEPKEGPALSAPIDGSKK